MAWLVRTLQAMPCPLQPCSGREFVILWLASWTDGGQHLPALTCFVCCCCTTLPL